MWWYRGLSGLVLVAGLVACAGDDPAGDKVDRGAVERAATAADGEDIRDAAESASDRDAGNAETVEEGADIAGGGGSDAGEEPVHEPGPVVELPLELDLSLPREPGIQDGEPLQAEPGRLPDLFQVEPPKRRTSVSGELILGDSEEERAFDMERIQGGKIDVEVSLD